MPESGKPLQNLIASATGFDRDTFARSTPDFVANLLAEGQASVLHLRGDRFAVQAADGGVRLELEGAPVSAGPIHLDEWIYLGTVHSQPVLAHLGAPDPDVNETDWTPSLTDPGQGWVSLRQVALLLSGEEAALAFTAVSLANWHAKHHFCPQCGAPTHLDQAGWVRRCEADGSQHFPRTDPAVIMAIVDADDRLLLARGPRWKGIHRSVLAGFVEPGESFEMAVARETFEESGVRVGGIEYVGNQPWPFPSSLMVGFTARATTTTLTPQEGEIEAIGWYSRADVARLLAAGELRLPGPLSIARQLIERWYGGALPDAKDAS